MKLNKSEQIERVVIVAAANITTLSEILYFQIDIANTLVYKFVGATKVGAFIEEIRLCLRKLGVEKEIELSWAAPETPLINIVNSICAQLGITPITASVT